MSGKSVAQKLLIKQNTSVWLSDPAQRALIEPLPQGVSVVGRLDGETVALVFAAGAASLRDTLDTLKDQLAIPKVLWIAYPKANRTDVNRDSLWPILAGYGMRPVTQVAIDDIWSALRFRPLKKGEKPFTVGRTSPGD